MKKREFKLKNTGYDLNALLYEINKEEYLWYLEWDDIHILEKNFKFLFENKTLIKNKEFWKKISDEKYIVVSCIIKLYKNESDFKNKNHSLLVQIDDTIFGIIFVNDTEIDKIVSKNISNINDISEN